MSATPDPRRQLPPVDRLLADPRLAPSLETWSRRAVIGAVRIELDRARKEVQAGGAVDESGLVERCLAHLSRLARPSLRRVVNATGVVLHTNLGRAPLDHVREELEQAIAGYDTLEFDLAGGERGSRQSHLAALFRLTFPNHEMLAVNNNAAALLLALNTLALGREVIVSRGELVEIGGSFRVPEILERSGARLREVGSTNRTHAADYEAAISAESALILKVWPSNFRLIGFTKETAATELSEIARRRQLPLLIDQGCGRLFDESPGPESEPSVESLLAAGADLVAFSGDKLLGGPQAGLLVGNAQLIARCAKNPLMRALRPDKLTIAALAATLRAHLGIDPAHTIPAARMLRAGADQLRARAQALATLLGSRLPALEIEVLAGSSRAGGGSAPEEDLPSWLVAVRGGEKSDEEWLRWLRGATLPVIARVQAGRVLLDVRTLDDSELELVVKGFEPR